jgi:hypothetical protein
MLRFLFFVDLQVEPWHGKGHISGSVQSFTAKGVVAEIVSWLGTRSNCGQTVNQRRNVAREGRRVPLRNPGEDLLAVSIGTVV